MNNIISVKKGFGIYGMINNLAKSLKKVSEANIPIDEIDQKMTAMRSEMLRLDNAYCDIEYTYRKLEFKQIDDSIDRCNERMDMIEVNAGTIKNPQKPSYSCKENVIFPDIV